MHAVTAIRDLSWRRKLIAATLAFSLVGTGIGSLAVITDSLTVTNTHTAVTIDLQASSDGTTFQQSLTASFSHEAGAPAQYQPVVLKNTGNTQLRYALRTDTTGALEANLRSAVYAGITPANCVIGNIGTATPISTSVSGTGMDAEPRFGDPAQGSQAGDRTLNGNATENLCISHSATSGGSGSATQTATFSAESTLNNP